MAAEFEAAARRSRKIETDTMWQLASFKTTPPVRVDVE
jgi:hypothetical protein